MFNFFSPFCTEQISYDLSSQSYDVFSVRKGEKSLFSLGKSFSNVFSFAPPLTH